jgi:gas vesicle protein
MDDATQTKIEEEIRALKDALRMTDGYKRDLTNAAEKVLLDSPVVKMGKWFLLLAIVTGMAVWIGGSIYGAIQIRGIEDRTAVIEQKMAERTKEIDEQATEALKAIANQKTEVSNAAADAVKDADNQKNLVREKLAVDQLPDIRQLKKELEDLAQAGGRLNLHCLSLLSGRAVWVVFGTAALSFLLSLYALIRMHL